MTPDLLIKFLTHTCSQEELEEVSIWIAIDSNNAKWLFEMEELWGLKRELEIRDNKIEESFLKFKESYTTPFFSQFYKKIFRNKTLVFLKYAAIVIVISILGVNLYRASNHPISFNELEIPQGQYMTIKLSDGTRVWLNSESKLKYPVIFNSKSRLVYLEGEAYFEVSHKEKSPFVVESSFLKVKVLGTKFNMRVYADEETSTVSLAEGRVEVSEKDYLKKLTMQPGDALSYDKKRGMSLTSHYSIESTTSWIKGEIEFEEKSLEYICNHLERKFCLKINIIDKDLKSELFTCHFQKGVDIDEVMRLLKATQNINYRIKEKTKEVEIFKKKCP